MLRASNLSKQYGALRVLDKVQFYLGAGERAGLIGPNGAGKTTLLRLLIGRERPDMGSVWVDPHARVGYLEQGMTFAADARLADVLRDPREDVIEEIERYAQAVATDIAVIDDYQRALDRLDAMGGYPNEAHRAEILAQLGLAEFSLDTPVRHLSGGQKTRLGLARVLLGEPNVLLLDEPTNHLDIGMLEWLEGWLAHFRGAALIVSHDRVFLDRAVNRICELDAVKRDLKAYSGNYSAYLAAKSMERAKHEQEYRDQQDEIARLAAAAAHIRGLATFKKGGKADSSAGADKFAKGHFGNRALGTVGRARRIEARVDKLLSEDHIEKPRSTWQMKVEFQAQSTSQDVLVLDQLTVGYGVHALLRDVSLHVRRGERIALLGENGVGKSTLIKTIAGLIPPLGGTLRFGPQVKLGYFAQEQVTGESPVVNGDAAQHLDPRSTPLASLRRAAAMSETDARTFLHKFLFTGDQPLAQNATLSFGERARLMLALLVAQGCNFLLLDEPINHLDLPARAQLEQALSTYEGTVLAVVHDRYFVQGFATRVLEAGEQGIGE
jgi:ATP-binding cassette subfamily F protein 3